MASTNTYSGLEKLIRERTQIILAQTGERIKQLLIQSVKTFWYNDHAPNQYDRTYQVLDSISIECSISGGSYYVKIFFDADKIQPIERSGGNPYDFNAHMSIDGSTDYNGISIGEWVVYWMEYGQNSPLYSYGGEHFIETTREYADRNIAKLINEEFRKHGIECRIM